MTQPASDSPTNWTGIAFGLSLAVLAAYQQLKLPPVLPVRPSTSERAVR